MKRRMVPLIFVVVSALIASVALIGCEISTLQFQATFDTPDDFFNRFDYGYSGPNPWDWGNGTGEGATTSFHGDHDLACEGPTTDRTVAFGGDRSALDASQLFWWCAPSGSTTGHVMTGVDTISYNHAWFSPKAAFDGISKVCWDINETDESHRKWTEVQFVGNDDAHRYPSGTPTSAGVARGSGGYDLGYTDPNFRQDAPNTGIFPDGGTLAGLEIAHGSVFAYFANQDTWQQTSVGWPGFNSLEAGSAYEITDKAARYQHCLSNNADGTTMTITQNSPFGFNTYTIQGQIPQDTRRVVFHDSNYDPPKDSVYDPTKTTWHWDNIQVYSLSSTPT